MGGGGPPGEAMVDGVCKAKTKVIGNLKTHSQRGSQASPVVNASQPKPNQTVWGEGGTVVPFMRP